MKDNREKTLLISLGNIFRSDDRVSFEILEILKEDLKERCDYFAAGDDFTHLLDLWHDRHVIVIDSYKAELNEIGHIKQVTLEEMTNPVTFTSHKTTLQSTFQLAQVLDKQPKSIQFIALGAQRFCFGQEVDPRVKKSYQRAVNLVKTLVV